MLTPALKVAKQLEVEVVGVVVGHRVKDAARELIYHGADRVIVVDHPNLETYFPDVHALVLARLAERFKPELILVSATMRGREMAPYIANHLRAGITADCVEFDVDPKTRDVGLIRPPFAAIMLATIRTPTRRPQIGTARPNVFPVPPRDESREVRVDEVGVDIPKPRARLVETRRVKQGGLLLEKAEYIVSGGKGIGGPEGFKLLEELANELGGVVAGSRKATDAGWVPPEAQVGQTGKTVKPILYIAVGISGAAQHVFGIREAKRVVAINIDPEAPIFKHADYGIVGDYKQVVPALIEAVRKVKAAYRSQVAEGSIGKLAPTSADS
jgi:electron transfer flavoprotein alpha subunit